MIAIAFSLALGLQEPLTIAEQFGDEWAHVEPRSYFALDVDTDGETLFLASPAQQGSTFYWLRFEMLTGRYRSQRQLTEVDCDGWRVRSSNHQVFTLSNFGGDAPAMGYIPFQWTPAPPDSFIDGLLTRVC